MEIKKLNIFSKALNKIKSTPKILIVASIILPGGFLAAGAYLTFKAVSGKIKRKFTKI